VKKLFFAVLLIGLIGTLAFADQTSTNMYVYAYLLPNVSVSAGNLDFGTFVPSDYTKSASTTISVGASSGTVFSVALDAGQNFGAGWRRVANAGSFIQYGIFKSLGGAEWGDNDHANTYLYGSSVAGTSTGVLENFTVNGSLFAYQANGIMPTGYYTDTVVVTVYY
jgi:spore coat protein U-like protein